jgi:predicted restriction endonuclease
MDESIDGSIDGSMDGSKDESILEKSLHEQTSLMFEKDGYNYMLELKDDSDKKGKYYLHMKLEHIQNRRVWTLKVREGDSDINPDSLLEVFKDMVNKDKFDDHPDYKMEYPKDENQSDDKLSIRIVIKHQLEQFNIDETYILKSKKSKDEKQKEVMVKSGMVLAGAAAIALVSIGYKMLKK